MLRKPCGTFDENYVQDSALVRTRFRWTLLALLLAGLFIAFPWLASNYLLDVMTNIAITVIAVLGLQIVIGFTGQISLGHAAFMAAGAYASGMISYHLGWSFWISMPLAALSSGLLGLIVAIPALRIRGFYIAVTTLVAHFIIMWGILHGGNVTMGLVGLSADDVRIGSFALDNERRFYYLAMTLAVLTVFLTTNLMRTRIGRAMLAVRDNDLAASFMGINVFRTKITAFFLSSLYAGVAGALMAHYQGIITVEQFTLMDSIWMLGMIIIGGPSIIGAVFGVFFMKILHQIILLLAPWIGGLFPLVAGTAVAGFMQLFFGAVIIWFLVFEPRGLAHRWQIILSIFRLWPFPH
ncbi:MAG: branched-chain amino acid ABC transporter permease [Proteobacteria bacterium]|nr:branched-chain amino acid ABC transporter permease [Pseudomonadota bacterium]